MSGCILGTKCDQCVCMVQRCFTSTETVRLIRTGEPRTATSTVTELLNSVASFCFTFVWSTSLFHSVVWSDAPNRLLLKGEALSLCLSVCLSVSVCLCLSVSVSLCLSLSLSLCLPASVRFTPFKVLFHSKYNASAINYLFFFFFYASQKINYLNLK